MGRVVEIAMRKEKRGFMEVYASAKISFKKGVGDDTRGAIQNHRQVTVLTVEGWEEACKELDAKLHWTIRRANILVEGIDLRNTTGDILKIGDFYLEITGELTPCYRMDEQVKGLTKALEPNWRGGVTCKILTEGVVTEGDEVTLGERTKA
jgi:MOSC domain-containing protein YiiM